MFRRRKIHHNTAQTEPSEPFFPGKKTGSVLTENKTTDTPFFGKQKNNAGKHSEDLLSPQLAGDTQLENAYDNIKYVRIGSRGEHVVKIQQGLVDNGLALPQYGTDGIFGLETLSALKNYQADNNLEPDGIVGPKTIGALDRFYLNQLGIPIQLGLPNLPPQFLNQTSTPGVGLIKLNTPGVVETVSDPLMLRSTPEVSKPSSKNAVGKLGKGTRVDILSRTKTGWLLIRGSDLTSGSIKIGFVKSNFIREPNDTTSPTVDKIDAVTNTSGAISGYGPVLGKANLNHPGEFNDEKSGECKNVHQIQFHFDKGDALKTQPERRVKGFFQHGTLKMNKDGGIDLTSQKPDGPIEHEVRVPTKNKFVVADAPGVWSFGSNYPFKMELGFELTLASNTGKKIAKTEYDVSIEKKNEKDIPNTKNELKVKSKKDLVRNKNL